MTIFTGTWIVDPDFAELFQYSAYLETVIVGLAAIVGTAAVLLAAVVQRTVTHESVLEGLLSLTMPLVVSHHLFLFDKHSEVTIHAVEMLPISQFLTVLHFALSATAESATCFKVVEDFLTYVLNKNISDKNYIAYDYK